MYILFKRRLFNFFKYCIETESNKPKVKGSLSCGRVTLNVCCHGSSYTKIYTDVGRLQEAKLNAICNLPTYLDKLKNTTYNVVSGCPKLSSNVKIVDCGKSGKKLKPEAKCPDLSKNVLESPKKAKWLRGQESNLPRTVLSAR